MDVHVVVLVGLDLAAEAVHFLNRTGFKESSLPLEFFDFAHLVDILKCQPLAIFLHVLYQLQAIFHLLFHLNDLKFVGRALGIKLNLHLLIVDLYHLILLELLAQLSEVRFPLCAVLLVIHQAGLGLLLLVKE